MFAFLSNAMSTAGTWASEAAETVVDMGRGVRDFVVDDVGGLVMGEAPVAAPSREVVLEDPAAHARVRDRSRRLFDSMDGMGTDMEAIRAELGASSPEELDAIRTEYYRCHHRDLDTDLVRETSGASEDEVRALLENDPVERACGRISALTRGLDTDEEGLTDVLSGLSEEDRAAVMDRMGGEGEFRALLDRETSGATHEVAVAYAEGRREDARVAQLDDAIHGGLGNWIEDVTGLDAGSTDTAVLERVLGEGNDADREALVARYAETHEGTTLAEDIEARVEPGVERDLELAVVEGDEIGADAARLEQAVDPEWYTNPVMLAGAATAATIAFPVLAPLTLPVAAVTAGLAAMEAIDQSGNLSHGGEVDLNATDTDAFFGVIERRPEESEEDYTARIAAIGERMRDEYGHEGDAESGADVMAALAEAELGAGTLDARRATDTMADGELDPALALVYARDARPGTMDEMAVDALHAPDGSLRSREEIAEIERRYAELTGVPEEEAEGLLHRDFLEGGLWSEMSGREGFDFGEALHGAAESDEERIEALERAHAFHRDTWGAGLVDAFSSSGGDYDRHIEEATAMRERLEDGELTEEDRARLDELEAWMGGDRTSYRARQDEAADTVATGAELAVTAAAMIGTTVATGGAAAPAWALAGSIAAGGAVGMGTRAAILGDGYSHEAGATDLGRTVVSSAAAGLTAGLEPALLAGAPLEAGSAAAARMLATAPGALASTAFGEATRDREGHEYTSEDLAGAGVRLAGSIAAAGLGRGTEVGIGAGDTYGSVLRAAAAGGVVHGATEALIDPRTLSEDGLDTLGRMAVGGARGAVIDGGMSMLHHASERYVVERDLARLEVEVEEPVTPRATMLPDAPEGPLPVVPRRPGPDVEVSPTIHVGVRPPALEHAEPGARVPLLPTDDLPRDFDPSVPVWPRTVEEATALREAGHGTTNPETRWRYQAWESEIPARDLAMAEAGASLRERARAAYEARRTARDMARAGMIDRPAAADLRTRDRAVYGESRPDGPEFDDLYAAARARGLSEDDAYRDIIASSTRSNPGYNARTGVPGHRFSIRGPRREPRPRLFPENTLTSDRPTLPMGTPADPYAE